MMSKSANTNGSSFIMKFAKRPYNTPALLVHGQVAELTRGQSTCGDNDSTNCTVGALNMGPKAM